MCHLLKYKFSHKFINVPRKALEDIKFQASIIDIEENIKQLKSLIQNKHIEFVFNIDQMSCLECEDLQDRILIVLINNKSAYASYPVSPKV